MEFRIVYGRSGSGKTTFIFNEIQKKINCGKKIYVIVPEQFSFSAENHLLESIGTGSSINAEVLTLSRMADRVISEALGNNLIHLSKIGKSMIVYDALDSLKNRLNFLRNSDKNLDLALRMITEFKKHNVGFKDIEKAIDNIDDKYLKLKLTDSCNVLREYQNKITGNFLDESDRLELLAENIELVDFFKSSIIYIDEFAGFTPNEYKIIEKLCTLSSEITVTICTDSDEKVDNIDESIYYFNQVNLQKLLKIAKRNGCFIDKIDLGGAKKFKSKELQHLEENIYNIEGLKHNNETQDISLFVAKNPSTEVNNIATKILDLVKNSGYRYKDIAVVCANLDNYSSDIKSIFKKYNIPVFIDEKKDINNNSLMKYIVSLLNIFSSGFSYEAMFSYIKCGLLDINEDDIFLLERYVNKWGIRGTKWYREDFNFEEKNDIQDKINITRRAVIKPILEFKENLGGEKTAKEICKSLYGFIEKNGIIEVLTKKADEMEKVGQYEIAEDYRAGMKLFFDVLDEIVLVFDDEKMSFERFNKILQVGISKSEFGRIPASFDQVLCGDIDRSRTREIKVLFLLGLNDGIIPSIVKDEGFLNDKDRDILKENDVELAKSSIELLYENQFNIYRILTTPQEKLFLSYPITDKEGNALRASILIAQIKKIFSRLKQNSDIIISNYQITTKEATLDLATEKYKELLDNKEIDNSWKDTICWYKENDSKRFRKITNGVKYTNIPQKISEENINKMYGNSLRTSASRLEQYRRCPFAFHMKYGLKLKEEEEFKIRAVDTGNFMHEVIDEVFTKIEDKELDVKNITKEELYTIVSDIINLKLGISKNYIFSSSPKFVVLTRKLKKVVYESIDYIIESLKNSKFELYGHEIEFNEKADLKPMKLKLEDNKQVIVTGKIDRVDVAKTEEGNYVRIIDYKSSVKDVDLDQVAYGIQIQLLTYLDEIAEQKNFNTAGVLYFNLLDTIVKSDKRLSDEEIRKQLNKKFKMKGLIVADLKVVKMMDSNLAPSSYSETIPVYLDKEGNISKSKSSVLDKEKFEKLQKYTKHVIEEISKEIFAGKIDIKPFYRNKKTPCEYCEYKSICNFDPKIKGNEYGYVKSFEI